MNPRTTGILFAVAALLAAFVYFYEIGGEQERKEAEQSEKRLFGGIEAQDIESVSLRSSDGVEVELQRAEDGWRIIEPIDFRADTFAADGIASALAQMTSESVIEEPRPPAVYGLDEGAVVRFHAGGADHLLRTGDATPVGQNSYVAVEGVDAVYTVATHRVSSLNKEFAGFREKRIAKFDVSAVRQITASWPDGRVVIERADDDWKLTAPLEGPADSTTVDELLSDLSFLRADGFIDVPMPEHAAGFEVPEFAVLIEMAAPDEGETPVTVALAFGGQSDDGAGRLVRGAEKSLYIVAASALDDLPRDLVAYRFRQLAKFFSSDAKRVDLGFHSASGESFIVTATRGDAGWNSDPDPIREGAVARLVTELSNLRAENILADEMGPAELAAIGLVPPRAIVSIHGEGEGAAAETLAEVHIGAIRAEGIAARIPDLATVFELETALAEHIPVSLEAFRNRFVAEAEPAAEAPALPDSELEAPPGGEPQGPVE